MTNEEILSNLCYYNKLNPNYMELYDDIEHNNIGKECYCDNCFYGRDKLANELLKYININN